MVALFFPFHLLSCYGQGYEKLKNPRPSYKSLWVAKHI